MRRSSKYRRHQTAYEAPEIEGEFLNESADTILSVSDERGNLTNPNFGEIDPLLLEEFNEDQASIRANPYQHKAKVLRRSQKEKDINIRRSSVYLSARALLDKKRSEKKSEVSDVEEPLLGSLISENLSEWDLSTAERSFFSLSKKAGAELRSRPYLMIMGGMALGFVLARTTHSRTNI